MARERPVDYLAAHVLERPEFRQACAERDLGEVLRLAKRWGGVGFTASHLARRCELTVSRVQDYVNGRVRAQRVELFERVADGLRIPGAMFDLAARPWEDDGERVLRSAGPAYVEVPTEDGDSPVLRRDFVKLGAGITAAALAGPMAGVPSGSAGNRAGASSVEALRANLTRLRPLDDHLGGADTYRLYLAELKKTESLLKNASLSGATRSHMQALLAEQAQQAGWAAFDAGWHGEAQRLYERSFTAAREADAGALAGNALALRAYQLLSLGKDATDLTDKSCSLAGGRHPAVQSLLYQRGAWTYAVAGDAKSAGRALGRAEDALAAADGGTAAPEWAAWAHDETELRIMAGRCWSELHKPLRAVPTLEAAMENYGDNHARDKALYLSWLADSYLDAGEIDQASAVTVHALDLADGVASARPYPRLDAVLDRFEPYKATDGVADLLARRPLHPLQVRR